MYSVTSASTSRTLSKVSSSSTRGKKRARVESPKDPASFTTRLSSTVHAILETPSRAHSAGASTAREVGVAKTLNSDSSGGGEADGGEENFSTFASAWRTGTNSRGRENLKSCASQDSRHDLVRSGCGGIV